MEANKDDLGGPEWAPAQWVLGAFVAVALMLGLIAEGGRIAQLETDLKAARVLLESATCTIGELEADLEWDDQAIAAIRTRISKTQRRLAGPDVFPEAYTLEENGEHANRGEPWQAIPMRPR